MAYTNSKLVAYTKLSPNHSGQRTHSIDRITPHCVVGQCTAEGLGDWFAQSSIQASSNYGIDRDGRVGLYVEEKNRSWCSSSNANDQRAITIECASDTSEPYAFRDVVYKYEGIWEQRDGVWHHIEGGLKHPGTTGPQYYRLQPFQVFVLASMFLFKVWINTEAEAGTRELLPTEKVMEEN